MGGLERWGLEHWRLVGALILPAVRAASVSTPFSHRCSSQSRSITSPFSPCCSLALFGQRLMRTTVYRIVLPTVSAAFMFPPVSPGCSLAALFAGGNGGGTCDGRRRHTRSFSDHPDSPLDPGDAVLPHSSLRWARRTRPGVQLPVSTEPDNALHTNLPRPSPGPQLRRLLCGAQRW